MKLGLLGLALALSTPAFADEATPPDGGQPDPSQPPEPDPDAPGRWPRSVILRPLTLPSGIFMPGFDLKTHILNDTTGFFDPANLRVLVGYGITDSIEIAFADYSFNSNAAGKGNFMGNIGVKVVRGAAGGKLEAIARVQGGYGLATGMTSTGGTEGAPLPLQLGAQVQYNVNEKITLITPGQQLSIGLAEGHVSSLDLLVGIGYQATPELYTQLDTSIAHINLHGDATKAIFADSTPITITGIYNVIPALDAIVSIYTDISNEVDQELTVLVGARYYVGRL